MQPQIDLTMKSIAMDQVIHPDEALDRLVAMKSQEEMGYKCSDYLSAETCEMKISSVADSCDPSSVDSIDEMEPKSPIVVDADCRVKMCQWSYQVLEYFNFSRETVAISMSYLDRFLCTEVGRPYLEGRSGFQLAAITALYIAIKIHEPMELDLSLLVELSRNCYSVGQIAEMETRMLEALKWRMSPPTPLSFVQHMLALLPPSVDTAARQSILDVARYQTEFAVFDYNCVTAGASSVALAAIMNAMDGVDECYFSKASRAVFIRRLAREVRVNRSTRGVGEARRSLLAYLAQARPATFCTNTMMAAASDHTMTQTYGVEKSDSSRNLSPVSVSTR